MRAQRGFTLPELLIVVAILVVLLGIAILSLTMRPAALLAGANDFDASLAAARAIAAASGNGATLTFAPRTNAQGRAIAGFALRVYRGRPRMADALEATSVPVVASDADVREASLGAPPFAIFINSAGNATGKAAYAVSVRGGSLDYPVLPEEPPCPGPGFLQLTFRDMRGNAATRSLACTAPVVGVPVPLATMSPDRPRLTPPQLVFVYPQSPHAHFVATEWGYTRWFAAIDGFDCGAAAAFDREPQPYSPPHSSDDADALPQAPPGVPYSFANSSESMQDAPAWFWLAPTDAGLCSATLADAFGQQVRETVQVMGALTIQPDGLSFDSASAPPQVAALSKIYDAEPIVARVLSSNCAGIADAQIGTGTAPPQPSTEPASTPITVYPRGTGACITTFGDQYTARGEPPVTLSITVGEQACSRIGGICVLHLPANIEGASCEPSGQKGGVDVFYSAAFAPGSENRGTLVKNGNGTWAFTRTAPGPVRIDENQTISTFIPRPGQGCTVIVRHTIVRSWNF